MLEAESSTSTSRLLAASTFGGASVHREMLHRESAVSPFAPPFAPD